MDHIVKNFLVQLKFSGHQTVENLIMFPLVSAAAGALDYLLLDDALERNLIEISEVDQSGSVPNLMVVNRAERMVLLLDGEELVGAKQNRVINTSILLAPSSKTVIPVSCCEQGRWSYRSEVFSSMKRVMSPDIRARKASQVSRNLEFANEYCSDQGDIWDSLDMKAASLGAESPTGAMSEMFEKQKTGLDDYCRGFACEPHQCGALFLINGRVAGLDVFGKEASFTSVFDKLVRSYALDALQWRDKNPSTTDHAHTARQFLERALQAACSAHDSIGLGTDIRLSSDDLTGFALQHEQEIVHLCLFANMEENTGRQRRSRMVRFSDRIVF